jgi:hypothetical protein
MIVYEDHPLYQKQPVLDASTFPTVTTEKSRKVRFYLENKLSTVFKALSEREIRRKDVSLCQYV